MRWYMKKYFSVVNIAFIFLFGVSTFSSGLFALSDAERDDIRRQEMLRDRRQQDNERQDRLSQERQDDEERRRIFLEEQDDQERRLDRNGN